MKKVLAMLIAAVMVFSMTACGGSEKEEKGSSVNGEALFQVLLQQVTYDSLLTDQGQVAAMFFSGMPQGATVKLYRGVDAYSDYLGLMTLKSAEDQEAARNSVAGYLQQLHKEATNYHPEKAPKFENPAIWQNGVYLIFCVTEDVSTAQSLMDKAAIVTMGIHAEEPTVPEETTSGAQSETSQTTQEVTEPAVKEYPKLTSQSGTYSYYGSSPVCRVDNSAFDGYGYDDYVVTNYTNIINAFAEEMDGEAEVYVLAIPTAIGIVMPDDIAQKMKGYENQNERMELTFSKFNDKVTGINCYDNLMQHRDEYLYFRTDFHWNGKAAYYAYEIWCKAVGETPYTLDQRRLSTFDNFYGALYWQSCNQDSSLLVDTVEAYHPYNSISMTFTDTSGKEYIWDVVMDVSSWSSGLKYSAFGGGDNPITVYQNKGVTDGSVGIVVKESFGNALMPYMVDHYSTLYEIDYRYWDGNLAEFAREVGATEITFANNMQMMSVGALVGMLAGIMD